jgi:hypothetical protein
MGMNGYGGKKKNLQYIKMTNKMQLCRIIYYSLTALHVSSDIFAHHQAHLNCKQLLVLQTYVAAGWYHGRVGTQSQHSHDTSRQRHTCLTPEAVHS